MMMTRRHVLTASVALPALAVLPGCLRPAPRLGPDGVPLPAIYRIDPADVAGIRLRARDGVNAQRHAEGVPPLALDAALNAAAAAHARDMAARNRAGHIGPDGATPVERAGRAGYRGTVLGEAIAESYEDELQTVTAWSGRADTRAVLVDPRARDMGLGGVQMPGGKIWWCLVLGDGVDRA
ncbi:MAG: CAP domain-containing protein [Roseicyclus sp.]|nr:CAP domain-containing protein [Roseicyclus sp.]